MFFTPEECDVVRDRFRFEPLGEVVGIGIELAPLSFDSQEFRRSLGIDDEPYLVYVGRLDPMKGVKQLCDFFIELKKQYPSRLKLVLAGDPMVELPDHPDIMITGFLEEPMKQGAIKGALALVQSSYFESFSIVLCEAWVQGRPALVQGASTVLRGQAMRSGGAIPYEGYAEFEQAVVMLMEDSALADKLGVNGRRYVEEHYEWAKVLQGVERSLELAKVQFAKRPISLSGS
jgi:glycosyltransferase involved in cell wall biosynthesis